jgi:hypothetical protein
MFAGPSLDQRLRAWQLEHRPCTALSPLVRKPLRDLDRKRTSLPFDAQRTKLTGRERTARERRRRAVRLSEGLGLTFHLLFGRQLAKASVKPRDVVPLVELTPDGWEGADGTETD